MEEAINIVFNTNNPIGEMSSTNSILTTDSAILHADIATLTADRV